MSYDERYGIIESLLFVSGDPIQIAELTRALSLTELEMASLLQAMDKLFKEEKRGVQLYITQDSVQLVSNKEYSEYVQKLLQPACSKSLSQAMLETMSVIAYKQPITRAEIEAVRGVRCDYTVHELMKLGMVKEAGRKDAIGRPVLLATTDAFLRHFGLNSLNDLPEYKEPGNDVQLLLDIDSAEQSEQTMIQTDENKDI